MTNSAFLLKFERTNTMGFRKITPAEFNYIHELATKKKLSTPMIEKLTGRAVETINHIKKSVSFKDYLAIKKAPKLKIVAVKFPQHQPTAEKLPGIDPVKVMPKDAEPKKDYTGALLGQMHRLCEAISQNNALVSHQNLLISKLVAPKFTVKPVDVTYRPMGARVDCTGKIVPDKTNSADWVVWFILALSLVGLYGLYLIFIK
jgi:hypothetical protein